MIKRPYPRILTFNHKEIFVSSIGQGFLAPLPWGHYNKKQGQEILGNLEKWFT